MVEVILETTTRILEREGLPGVTTNRVAEIAGISVGSLYQYYPSRDAILAELVRRMRLSMSEKFLQAIDQTQEMALTEAVPRLMEVAVHQYATAPKLTAALEEAEARLPRDAAVIAGKRLIKQRMTACLAAHGVADPQEAALDLIVMTRAIVMTALPLADGDFAVVRRRIERAALGYLFYAPPEY
jgi:AcrR family transcriptional regulator